MSRIPRVRHEDGRTTVTPPQRPGKREPAGDICNNLPNEAIFVPNPRKTCAIYIPRRTPK
jgi:hypothetical protein